MMTLRIYLSWWSKSSVSPAFVHHWVEQCDRRELTTSRLQRSLSNSHLELSASLTRSGAKVCKEKYIYEVNKYLNNLVINE